MRILQRKLLIKKLKRISHFCKGYSVIEIIVAISVFTILMGSVVSVFVSTSVDFKRKVEETRRDFYVNEALRYIETEMHNDVKSIEVLNNVIILERLSYIRPEKRPADHIKLEGQNIVIKYYEYGYLNATNIILRNVEEFTASREGNLLFVGIKYKGSKRFEKCIGSSVIK